MKKILITGATGFIGSRLLPALVQNGKYEVVAFDQQTHGGIDGSESLKAYLHQGIDHVIHLAAIANVLKCWDETPEVMRVNIMGTQNVLDFCRAEGAGITLASTYLYGFPQYLPIGEQHPIHPNNPYAVSKKIAEDLCLYYDELFGVKCSILRMFNIYGPGQTTNFVIPVILEQLLANRHTGKDVEVRVLDSKRDYVYLDDLIRAFILSIDYVQQEHQPEKIFNIASGESYSVKDIFEIAKNLLNADIGIFSNGASRPNEIMDTRADITRASDLLGWSPKVSFPQGIKNMLEQSYQIQF